MVNIQDALKKPLEEVFPLTHRFICKQTCMVYSPEDIKDRMGSIALPILLAFEHHFEELENDL